MSAEAGAIGHWSEREDVVMTKVAAGVDEGMFCNWSNCHRLSCCILPVFASGNGLSQLHLLFSSLPDSAKGRRELYRDFFSCRPLVPALGARIGIEQTLVREWHQSRCHGDNPVRLLRAGFSMCSYILGGCPMRVRGGSPI